MFNELAGKILEICDENESILTNERKIEKIRTVTNELLLKSVEDNKIPKGLKLQVKAFEAFMKDLTTSNAYLKYSGYDRLRNKVYVNESYPFVFFGCGCILFAFERKGEFISAIPQEYISNDVLMFDRCLKVYNKVNKNALQFKLKIEYKELLAVKRINEVQKSKFCWEFKREVSNIYDSEDKIHRVFNAYSLIKVFKILGAEELEFYMTDNYCDNVHTHGYNNYVGNYSVLTTFVGLDHINEYVEETKERKKRIAAQKEEKQKMIKKGKSGKLKFTKLAMPDFPKDEDLPF